MPLFLIIAYFVTIFIFVTPVPVGIRLVFNNFAEKPSILIRYLNRSFALPKFRKKVKKATKVGFNFSYKNLDYSKIIIDNFSLEVATPKDMPPILNFSLFYLLTSIDTVLSSTIYDWYRGKSYISYVMTDKKQIYIQCKADIKINLFIIFSAFFQTIKVTWRKNGSD